MIVNRSFITYLTDQLRSFITYMYLTDQLHTSYCVNPCSFYGGGGGGMACLFFPGALFFNFYYDLNLCSQGQAVRTFFIGMCFSLILSKVRGF